MKSSPIAEDFYLRPFTESDVDMLWHWMKNSSAVSHLGFASNISKSEAARVLQRFLNAWQKLGFTKFACFLKGSDELAGYVGFELLHDPNNTVNLLPESEKSSKIKQIAGVAYEQNAGELELGYRLHKDLWGKGHATRLAKVLCSWAFENFDVERIVAVTLPKNIASQKVLLKTGFIYLQDEKAEKINNLKFFYLPKDISKTF